MVPPCRAEIPHLKAAYDKYAKKGFVIYGVSLDNDKQAWIDFVQKQGMNWPNVLAIQEDKSSPAADAYGIQSIPTNFLISPEGVIVAPQPAGRRDRGGASESDEIGFAFVGRATASGKRSFPLGGNSVFRTRAALDAPFGRSSDGFPVIGHRTQRRSRPKAPHPLLRYLCKPIRFGRSPSRS